MKRIAILFLGFILIFGIFAPISSRAQEQNKVYISFFYGDGCPHCDKEKAFLKKLVQEFPSVEVRSFEVWNNRDNAKILQKFADKINQPGISISSIPLTIIGSKVVSGYLNDETTGVKIRQVVKEHVENGCIDLVKQIQEKGDIDEGVVCEVISQGSTCDLDESYYCSTDESQNSAITLPIFGEINPQKWSLPILTIVIAAIDGFNPCAMWVLIFLISLLIGMKDRKKMWILGSAFIIASGTVYFLFLSAWLNLFLFLGFLSAIRVGIGIVAVASGAYHLKEWHTNREGVCKVGDMERKQKIMERFRKITSEQNFIFALGGIISIAIAVNLIELVCSAGLPAIFTNILALSGVSTFTHYLYLILYIIIFMLDDMLIFVIAMMTLQITGISAKYSRWSNLIGGVVILLLGLLLIFKPGWIMFG